jgi:hypothetical protein
MRQDANAVEQVSSAGEARAGLTKKHRRLLLLKRTRLLGTDTCGAEITRACSPHDLRRAYRLVYDIYLAAGYVEPHECQMRIRTFEALADTATFIAKRDGEVLGAASLVVDSAGVGLPSDVAFRPELDTMRARGIKLCETTNLAVLPRFRKTAYRLN